MNVCQAHFITQLNTMHTTEREVYIRFVWLLNDRQIQINNLIGPLPGTRKLSA